MSLLRTKGFRYGLLFAVGVTCLLFANHQWRYSRAVTAGNRAVAEQRFDSRDYEQASHFWLAQRNILLFNRGVLAYKAQNLARAADYFRRVSQGAKSPTLRVRSLYNLGMVMLALEEVQSATELFKQALRLDPRDKDTKFNLERLFHFVLYQEGTQGEASFKQAPGVGKEGDEHPKGGGQGRSTPETGI